MALNGTVTFLKAVAACHDGGVVHVNVVSCVCTTKNEKLLSSPINPLMLFQPLMSAVNSGRKMEGTKIVEGKYNALRLKKGKETPSQPISITI